MMFGKKLNQKGAHSAKRTIPVLVGPTSSGKTGLALEYCKQTGASIISADSRQIYKDMDIGTGKLPINSNLKIEKHAGYWVLDDVKVYGYDLVTPDQYFSGYDFAKFAHEKIAALPNVIVVGGTGFYIDLLTGRQLLTSTAPDLDLRSQLDALDLTALQQKLKALNLAEYETIDQQNKVRLVRAIEKELSSKQHAPLPSDPNLAFNFIGLTAPREYLYQRADAWVDAVFENGLIQETQALMQKYPGNAKLQGLVYKTVVQQLGAAETKQRIKWDIHAYIRRQQTWFKRNPDITWLSITDTSQKDCIKHLL